MAVIANRPWTGIPNSIVYQKGAWVLHMLRGYRGTPLFWQGIREYYHRYRDSNASTADLRKVMEDISGKDLAWFFGQSAIPRGVAGTGGRLAVQRGGQENRDRAGRGATGGGLHRLPLEVAVRGAGGVAASIARIEMTAARQSFEIPAESEPAAVELDPNTWVLMDAHFTKR